MKHQDMTPQTVVQLPHGHEGHVTAAPAGDWLAPGQHQAHLAGPVVYVEWAYGPGRSMGCWWRPGALTIVRQTPVRERRRR